MIQSSLAMEFIIVIVEWFSVGLLLGLSWSIFIQSKMKDRPPEEKKPEKPKGKAIFAEPVVPTEAFNEAKDIDDFLRKTKI